MDTDTPEDTLILRSSEDPGTTLSFRRGTRTSEETEFHCHYVSPAFSGRVRCSTFYSGSPARLFSDIAENWRGWDGEKTWFDIDDALGLVATSDRFGHVRIRVTMKDHSGHVLNGSIVIDAGEIDRLAIAMRRLLPTES